LVRCLASKLDESEDEGITDYTAISEVKQETEQMVEHLQGLTSALEQAWNDYVKECEHFVGSIYQMIQLVKSRDPSLKPDPIEAKSKALLSLVRSQEWPEKSMNHYETVKVGIRKEALQLLRETLDEAEGNVLMAVVDRREQSQGGWFSLPQITREIAKETTLSDGEVENLLRSLVRKGYLTEGIAIPV